MDENLYKSALEFVRVGYSRSPREIQNWFSKNKKFSPAQSVYFTCKFILEAVRREEVCIENMGCIEFLGQLGEKQNEYTEIPK